MMNTKLPSEDRLRMVYDWLKSQPTHTRMAYHKRIQPPFTCRFLLDWLTPYGLKEAKSEGLSWREWNVIYTNLRRRVDEYYAGI